jgi:hypothetical protein
MIAKKVNNVYLNINKRETMAIKKSKKIFLNMVILADAKKRKNALERQGYRLSYPKLLYLGLKTVEGRVLNGEKIFDTGELY